MVTIISCCNKIKEWFDILVLPHPGCPRILALNKGVLVHNTIILKTMIILIIIIFQRYNYIRHSHSCLSIYMIILTPQLTSTEGN